MCHSLGYQAAVCVSNYNSAHNSNFLFVAKSMSRFPWYPISDLLRSFPVKETTAMGWFSYVEFVQKDISTFLNFPVGDHSIISSIMCSVWPILKPRGYWQIRKFKCLSKDPYCILISKSSSKTLLNSGNYVSLLVLFRTSSLETVGYDTFPSENTLT